MRIIVISVQNNLLAGAITKYLLERGSLFPNRIDQTAGKDEPFVTCVDLKASVLLMEVSKMKPFTLGERMDTAKRLRTALPDCKIALLCDDRANPDLLSQIKDAKRLGEIDNFFYSSVTGEYLSDGLESM